MFFIDGIHEHIAIAEAKVLGIPVFGIVDSNTDPTSIDYPIPANDDSLKTIKLLVDFVSNKIIEALGGNVDSLQQESENQSAVEDQVQEDSDKTKE